MRRKILLACERINIGGFLLLVVVLSIALLRGLHPSAERGRQQLRG